MIRYWILLFLAALVMVSCGKNDAVTGIGYMPQPPPAQYPNYPQQAPQPSWNPQMPQGYQPQYYPFAPIHNYMQQSPYLQTYWQGMWQRWQQYAGQNQYNPMDWGRFWYEYCPQEWGYNTQIYVSFDNYYSQNDYCYEWCY